MNWILSIKQKNIPFGINSLNFLNIVSLILAVISVGFTISSDLVNKVSRHVQDNGAAYLVFFLIILVLVFYRMNIKNDIITSLKRQLDSETKELWKNYSELNDFYRQKTLADTMERFINSSPHVISVQRYKYRIFKNNRNLKIILNGDYTYVREGDDLNLVAQGYFNFDLNKINQIISAYAKARISLKTENENDDNYEELEDIFIDLMDKLNNINAEDYKDTDVFTFELIKLIHPYLESGLNMTIPLTLSESQLDALNGRKSGIDIAMFLLRDYINIKTQIDQFDYKGLSDSKKYRIYSNIQITNALGENYVYVLAHHPDETWSQQKKVNKIQEDTANFVQIAETEIHFIKKL
ncbi:hypothetical protein [Sporosarcina sp. HYO08]|uniref:hypothetical protein n=1 Tax=Sporosarcina sp. HYO08 TaxID=1759557 RepID=UPI0012E3EF76|nr:hypothetical protein [Sporosarcina sp. HYO08]